MIASFGGSMRVGCVHKGGYGHKGREEAAQALGGGAEARDRGGGVRTRGILDLVRRYDVNANQVFSWRRRYREASKASAALLFTAGRDGDREGVAALAQLI
jgi:transposase-like protein